MKTTTLKLIAIVLLTIITLNSCESVEDQIIDCIVNRHPVLISKQLKDGTVGELYSDFIYAEIKNCSCDDDYEYYFDIDGLPHGLGWYVDFRTVIFKGYPSPGKYVFTVKLWVESPLDSDDSLYESNDGLCTNFTEKKYSIIIH